VRALLEASDAISKPSFNGNGNGLVEGTPEEGERREEEKLEERNEGQETGDEYRTTDTSRQLQEDCDDAEEGDRGEVSSVVSRKVSGVDCVAQGAGGWPGETQDNVMTEKERNVRGEMMGETGSTDYGSIGGCFVDGEEGEMGESGDGGSRSEGKGRKDQKGTQESRPPPRGGGGRDNAGGSRGAGEEGGVGGGRGSEQDGDEDGREGRKDQDTKEKETEVQRKEDEKEKKRKEEEEERKKIAAEHERAHAIRLNAEAQREEAKRDKEFQEFNDKRIRQNIKDYDEVL
jgi:hypothetical protein